MKTHLVQWTICPACHLGLLEAHSGMVAVPCPGCGATYPVAEREYPQSPQHGVMTLAILDGERVLAHSVSAYGTPPPPPAPLHERGNPQCPACCREGTTPCDEPGCGGLVHIEFDGGVDERGGHHYACDRCGWPVRFH